MTSTLFLLAACGDGLTRATLVEGSDDTLPTAGPGPTELSFVDPLPGGFVAVGTTGITGIGRHLTGAAASAGAAARG